MGNADSTWPNEAPPPVPATGEDTRPSLVLEGYDGRVTQWVRDTPRATIDAAIDLATDGVSERRIAKLVVEAIKTDRDITSTSALVVIGRARFIAIGRSSAERA